LDTVKEDLRRKGGCTILEKSQKRRQKNSWCWINPKKDGGKIQKKIPRQKFAKSYRTAQRRIGKYRKIANRNLKKDDRNSKETSWDWSITHFLRKIFQTM
jgi:hypothetical protein